MDPLYVRPVEGAPIARYGTRVLVGAQRDPKNPRRIVWDPETIVVIPADEFARYRREYSRAIAAGSLVRATAGEWRVQNARGGRVEPAADDE